MRSTEKNKRKQKSSTLPLGINGAELLLRCYAGIYACCYMNKHTAIQSANHSAIRMTV